MSALSPRQTEIVRELQGRATGKKKDLLTHVLDGALPNSEIDAACKVINDEFLMAGVNEDFSPNAYGHELEALLDVINRPRLEMFGFYTVNDRPVKLVRTADGGTDVQVLDMKTGDWKRDMSYLARVLEPGADVDRLDEATFERRVEAIVREMRR